MTYRYRYEPHRPGETVEQGRAVSVRNVSRSAEMDGWRGRWAPTASHLAARARAASNGRRFG